MELKEKRIADMVSTSGSNVLMARLETFPEEEWDQELYPTEADLVRNIAGEIIEDYHDDGHCLYDELREARRVILERNRIAVNLDTFQMKPMHSAKEIDHAEAIISEYNNTRKIIRKLRKEEKRNG